MIQKLKTLAKLSLSEDLFDKLVYTRMYIRSLYYVGTNFFCPICHGHFRIFLPYGLSRRKNACCPRCRSLERHRLIWLYLQNRTNFFRSKLKALHFAPIYCFQRIFNSLLNLDYVSADLSSSLAMMKMDIMDIKFDDNSFDCILCIHVLDDRKAIKELYRVLKPNSWAILQVPIMKEKTFEDYSINTSEKRLKFYGQEDHFRAYGLDYKKRLEDAGFRIKVDPYLWELDENIINRYRLVPENEPRENIYFAFKP